MKTLNYYSKSALQSGQANMFLNQADPSRQFLGLYNLNTDTLPKLSGGEIKEAKAGFIARVSPFLLLAVFLMGFFPYLMITGKGPVENIFMLAILFPFTVGNIFYFDFVLWNSFKGKRLLNIWLIELTLSLVVYLIIANL